jgi:outer membrane autotransporter protein
LTLTINGNVTNTGTVNLDITNGSGASDRLAINGTATLGGTLNVTGVGAFVVTSNVPYTLLNYTSATGNFATYNLPTQAVNGWQTPSVGATSLTIRAN